MLDSSKLKEVADSNSLLCKKWRKILKTDRKHCRKMRMAPFPTMFSEDLYNIHVKTRVCFWERVKRIGKQ